MKARKSIIPVIIVFTEEKEYFPLMESKEVKCLQQSNIMKYDSVNLGSIKKLKILGKFYKL